MVPEPNEHEPAAQSYLMLIIERSVPSYPMPSYSARSTLAFGAGEAAAALFARRSRDSSDGR
jgi:hypothetical protein